MALSRDKVLREAERLVQKGKIEQAIREYEKLLKANPNDANTINRVGDLFGRIGQVEKAIELYEKIADHFTEDGFVTKAIAILKKINRLAPHRLDIFGRLGELYLQQGLTVEARNQYQILAEWYERNDDIESAVRAHKKLVTLDPADHTSHLHLADALMKAGEQDESLDVYDRLGRMLLEREKLEEAERLYRHVLDKSPARGDFLEPLCEALLNVGRVDNAKGFLQTGLRLSPACSGLQAMMVKALMATGEAREALHYAEKLLAEKPDEPEIRLLVGRVLLEGGEAPRARELLLPIAEAAVVRGNLEKAQSVLQGLIKAMPADMQVLSLALRAFEPTGNEEMQFTLKAALAGAHARAGQTDAAQRLYLELLRARPDNQQVRRALEELGSPPEMVGELEEIPVDGSAETPAPGMDDSGVLDVIEFGEPEVLEIEAPEPVAVEDAPGFRAEERLAEASVFAKYGLVDKAIRHLEDVILHFPAMHEAREKLVLLLVEEGRREAAQEVAQPLVDHYKDVGDDEGLKALFRAVLLEDGSAPTPDLSAVDDLAVTDGDALFVVEIEANEAELEVEAEPVEIEVLEIEPVEVEPASFEPEAVVLEAAEPAPATKVRSGLGIPELDELESLVLGRSVVGGPPPTATSKAEEEARVAAESTAAVSEPEPAAADAEAAAPDEDMADIGEEMVELATTVVGPPIGDLQQIDLFISQELFDDAVRVLEGLEEEFPDDPDVAERQLTLKSKGVLFEDVTAEAAEEPEELFAEEEEYIDLARELEQELAEEDAMVEEATGREVFREFQKGVAEQLSEEDSDTHRNLGIAYKEMGLLPEAIGEFQIASRDPDYLLECCSMIGACYLEQGMAGQAAQWYRKALEAPELTLQARLSFLYDLGAAQEVAGEPEEASSSFAEVASIDPTYRDVNVRLEDLQVRRQAN